MKKLCVPREDDRKVEVCKEVKDFSRDRSDKTGIGQRPRTDTEQSAQDRQRSRQSQVRRSLNVARMARNASM